MRPIWHFLSGLILFLFLDFKIALIAFLITFFIDLDHLFDFWKSPEKFFNIKAFLNSKKYIREKSFVFFHAWEFLIILIILGYFINWPNWFLGLVLGLSVHYLLDIYNLRNKSIFSYFLIFRTSKNFTVLKK